MKGYKWNSKEGVWQVSKGWRSWGIITCCSSYVLVLAIMAWYAIVGLLLVLPYIVIAIVVGLAVYLVLGGIR